MYGSSFKKVIFNPRLSSKFPMEAEASPFPSDETTPPVTKMNLFMAALFHGHQTDPIMALMT
jgi:hypothetical protein